MKISDLAALVTVRNHIGVVINDKSASDRGDFRALDTVRLALDKKFVEVVKSFSYQTDDGKTEANVDGIMPNELTLVRVGGNGYLPTAEDLQIWKNIFEEAQHDPDFKIFTHDAINVTQLEVCPGSEIRVRPAVEPRSIDINPNVSITKKGQMTLPLDKLNDELDKTFNKDGTIKVEALEGSVIGVPQADGTIELARVSAAGHSGDPNTTDEQVKAAVEIVAQGDIEKLDEGLDNLAKQNVKLTPAVVEEAVEPIKAPEEKKRKVAKKAEEPAQGADQDPEFQEALKREKEKLKKQGRSNKRRVKKTDET